MANFYKVNAGDIPLPSDVNQYADSLQGLNDVGALNLADNIAAPSSAPTAALASGSALGVGTYKYGYTYVTGYRKTNGSLVINGETPLSPVATIATTSGNQVVNLSNIGTSTAQYVVARRIYRTKVGGSTYYLLTTINDNSTTTFVDNVPDSSLSTTTAPSTNTTGSGFSKLNFGTSGAMGNMNIQVIGSDLHARNSAGNVYNETSNATFLTGNAYFDGTNWYRYNTSLPAAALAIQQGQDPQFWAIGSGTGSITWNQYRLFHEGNFNTRTHVLAYMWQNGTQQTLVNNSWNRVKYDTVVYDYLGEFNTSNWYFQALNTGIYMVSFGVRIINLSPVPGVNIMLGTNQLNRSGNYYYVFEDHPNATTIQYFATQVLYMSAGTQLECRVWMDGGTGGVIDVGQSDTWLNISRIA